MKGFWPVGYPCHISLHVLFWNSWRKKPGELVNPCLAAVNRVRTDPGKSRNFIVQNSRPWKVLEKSIGPGKSRKVLEL